MTPCERRTSKGYAGTFVVSERVPFSFSIVQSLLSSDSTSSACARLTNAALQSSNSSRERPMVRFSTNGRDW